jgi:hypothetical protein
MSDVKVIRALLAAHAPLVALVPTAKMFTGVVPLNTPLPALSINTVSNVERHKVADDGECTLMTSRTQVTVHGRSYPEQKAILQLVGLAIKGGRRSVAGVLVANVLRDIIGPDLGDSDIGTFEQTRDFRVVYYQPL